MAHSIERTRKILLLCPRFKLYDRNFSYGVRRYRDVHQLSSDSSETSLEAITFNLKLDRFLRA